MVACCVVLCLAGSAALPGGAEAQSLLTSTASAATTSRYLTFSPCCSWGTTWSFNEFNALGLGIADGLVYLPLAIQDDPSLTKFTPQLASSWSVSGTKLTLHIRGGVHWQDGQMVTARDVYDTIVLEGTDGGAGWGDWTDVVQPNAHEVVVTARKGSNMVLAEDALLPTFVYPASIYGRFVTPKLKADEIAYYSKSFADPAAAAKMPQYTAIGETFRKLAAYHVKTLVGDGPFKLEAINTASAKLVKWSGFYLAANVHVPGIDYLDPTTAAGYYPDLLTGVSDFSNVYMPGPIVKRWEATADAHTALVLSFTFNMEFNDHRYPLNITKVRQALAYAIPRKTIVDAAYGTGRNRGGTLNTLPDGLPGYLDSLYLTKQQLASLDTYPMNLAKASALLHSVGFREKAGKWLEPDGHPFTLQLLVNSATTDIVASFSSASKALDAFGIPTSVDATSGTIQSEDNAKGNFVISAALDGGVNPLDYFDGLLGSGNNFPKLGTYAGDRGLGFGPVESVPGLGKINVSDTIGKQASEIGPGREMDKLVWDWARLVNTQVPYLTYATKLYQFPYSTRHYVDWPPLNAQGTSPLWNIVGQGNFNVGLTLMLEDGYIRPRS